MDSSRQLATFFHLSSWKPAQKKPKSRLLNIFLPQVGFFFTFLHLTHDYELLSKKYIPDFWYMLQHHIMDRYDQRDKLTREAFGHLTEIRHLLRQNDNRWVFTIIRSSSDSLPITTWRGNSSNSDIKSIKMTVKRISSSGNPLRKTLQPLTTELPNRPPTHRSVKVYETTSTVLTMISAGLSLNLSNISPNSNNRMEYAETITGIVNTPTRTPTNKKDDDYENQPLATSTPSTRNCGVRKGVFDKNHHFRRFRS